MHKNCIRTAYKLHTNCIQTAYKLPTNFIKRMKADASVLKDPCKTKTQCVKLYDWLRAIGWPVTDGGGRHP